MKEHEHPYWTGVQYFGNKNGAEHRSISKIVKKHGGKSAGHIYIPEDDSSNQGFQFKDQHSHKKAEKALTKAGHSIEGKDY